ncbi:hypothetical protein FAES_1790 [Fibrella aestuarina BUZ 2]|uniref:Uncharacterized protein n=1 Tax=Fibrella aestuarina BUZ 2 TaxID=1166018 RepID=I0K6P7_9BACT|nr:hypothetical protein [Fibrella aestuarina]CCG99800.1 hypothetical protein FAES_1790 [Fibrella aestuarina BUZ 2]
MPRFYCLLLLSLLVTACKERLIEVPEPKPDPAQSWQVHPDFLFDRKVQLNSYGDDKVGILVGSLTTSVAPDSDAQSATDSTFVHYGGQATPDGSTTYQPLVHPRYIGFVYSNFIKLIATANPINGYTGTNVYLAAADKDFASFELINYAVGESFVSNQRNQLLIPYRTYDRSYNTPVLSGELKFALVSLAVEQTSPAAPSVLSTKQIQTLPAINSSFLLNLGSVGDYFIVSATNGVYRISPDGTSQKTYSWPMLRVFTYNNVLYGITQEYSDGSTDYKLVTSTDAGITWTTLASKLSSSYGFLKYKQVGDQLIAMYNNQLFQVTIGPTALTTKELDDAGLYGNRITSVMKFRNTVYVSTLSGVFIKPWRTFLTEKKTE